MDMEDYNIDNIGDSLSSAFDYGHECGRSEAVRKIIEKVDDMIGGKMIAQALREIYEVEE